jgi:hypothetical protein
MPGIELVERCGIAVLPPISLGHLSAGHQAA